MHGVLLWNRLINIIRAYFSNALRDAVDVFKKECIVSPKGVGPPFQTGAILKVQYSNNVRVRVTVLHCSGNLRNRGALE